MSYGASIDISDKATPFLERMHSSLSERTDIMEGIGLDIKNLCRDYVIGQSEDRHKTAEDLGANPTGFLGFAAEAIATEPATPDQVVIKFTHPWFSRVGHDVDIVPTAGQFLAIPIAAESYGKRLRGNFPGGFFFRSKAGNLIYGMKLDGGGLQPLYVLKESVHQPQDRDRLPSDEAIEKSAVDSMRKNALERLAQLQ